MLLAGGITALPVIASFSQSTVYSGLPAASLTNMSDGLFEPFTATQDATTTWVQANLAASAYVANIILGPSTATGGWGATFINGALLQYSNDNGSTWTTIRTLSGYVTATNSTTGTMKTEPIGVTCTNIRLLRNTGGGGSYIAVSEFKIAP